MESQDTISQSYFSAIFRAREDFPDAVGPVTAMILFRIHPSSEIIYIVYIDELMPVFSKETLHLRRRKSGILP